MSDNTAVKLPDAVQRQVAKANDMMKDRAEASLQEPEKPEKPEKPKAEPPKQKGEENWEQRFKGYKASTDQTIYGLRQSLAEMAAKVEQLTNENSQLAQRQPVAEAALPEDLKERLDGAFDQDEVSTVQQLIQYEASRMNSDLQNRINQLEAIVAAGQQAAVEGERESMKMTFESKLDDAAPGWRDIDTDPKFLEYLTEPDPNSLGRKRADLFKIAYQNGDVAGIARYYAEFAAQGPGDDPRLAGSVPRSQGSTPVPSEAPKVWRKGEYAALVQDKVLGRISEADFIAREKEYLQAAEEGRIER